jgi:transposase
MVKPMLRSNLNQQNAYELICIEELVPSDHLLRKIDQHIDFSFITDKVRSYYCETNGRPAIDPILLFKMLFIGYLFGVRSERRLEKEIQMNIAYRWFLGLGLKDPVPDHSTLSLNRNRLKDTDVVQEIFDDIVMQGMKHRMIAGRVLISDSTHVKANANKKKFVREMVTQQTREYLQELDESVKQDRMEHGKKPFKPGNEVIEEKEIKRSTTDSESGYMIRDGKPEGFFYLDHRTVDLKYNLITDVHITPGNVHDSVPYIERLERQIDRFKFVVEAVALDAGYLTTPICKKLKDKKIFTVIGHRRFHPTQGLFAKWKFTYLPKKDTYVCPNQQVLTYSTTDRKGYRMYKSNPKICKDCPMLSQCTRSKNKQKVVTRHVWEESKEWVRMNRLSKSGKELYNKRKETIERSFADAKELHGFRYCRLRGRKKVLEQALLTAACQNMKKIALHLAKMA